jgi:hypothetical protein
VDALLETSKKPNGKNRYAVLNVSETAILEF